MRYGDAVEKRYENPSYVGSMDKNDKDVGTGLSGAPACGDVMKLQLRINKDTQVIEDVKFKTFGCKAAIASSTRAAEILIGKTLTEALTLKNSDIAEDLALPPVKIHCSILAEDAVKKALSDYQNKQKVIDQEALMENFEE